MQLISIARRSRLLGVVPALLATAAVCLSCQMRSPTAADHHLDMVAVRGYTGLGDSPPDAGGSSESITDATKYYIGPTTGGDIGAVVTASGGVVIGPPERSVVSPDTTLIATGTWPDKDRCILLVDRWTSAPDSSWTLNVKQRDELHAGKAEVLKIAVSCGG